MSFARAWLLCCFLAACAPLEAATRVALIGNLGHVATGDCLALAEVELSGGSAVALVERREIARLLAEGELSLSGLVDAATAIRAGKLLRADLVAVVETDPQSSQALGILVFETASGMHLCDRALAEGDPEQAGRQIAEAVRLAVGKRALGPAARRSFCLVSVRNANLPLSANPLCDGVGRLVERALTNSPDIVVLERKRFELIKQEAALGQLAAETSETKLLAAVLTGEIEIRRGDGEEVAASAAVRTAEGKPLGTVRAAADYKDPLLLAEGLGPQLAAVMKAAPAARMTNRHEEAGRFAREALFWRRHRQFQQAMTSLEAALAVDPQSVAVLEAATEVCFCAAGEKLEPGRFVLPPRAILVGREVLLDSLALAERGMALAEAAVRRQAAERCPVLARCLEAAPGSDGTLRVREPFDGMFFIELYLERLPLIGNGRAEDASRFAALQRRHAALCKALDARAFAEVRDRQSFVRYTNWLSVLLRHAAVFSPTAKQWADDTAYFLEAWLKLADRYGVYQNEFFTLNTMIAGIANYSGQLDRIGLTGQWMVASSDARRLLAVFGKMAAHRRKAISALGRVALFISDVNLQQPLEDDALRDFKILLGQVQEVIRDPGPDDPRDTRVLCCYALLDAIESLPRTARMGQLRGLLDYMLARGEVVYGVALAASEPVHVAYRCYAPYLYRILGRRGRWPAADPAVLVATAQRVLRQLDEHRAACLDGQEGRLRYALSDACQAMFLARPELRPKAPPPWRRAVRLLAIADYPELRAISRVQVRGGAVWTMGLSDGEFHDSQYPRERTFRGTSDSLLHASGSSQPLVPRSCLCGYLLPIAVDLDTAERRVLAKRSYPRDSLGAPRLPYVDNCCFDMDERTLCVGSFLQGLCLVPLQGGPAEWLEYEGQESATSRGPMGENVVRHLKDADDDELLPSRRVLSVAVQDGKAYLSVGAFSGQGAFLVMVRLDNHKVRVISSSRGAKHQTPLDGLEEPPLIFLPFVKDPPRRRLLFVVSHPLSHSGLWELDTQTEKIRRLMPSEHYIHWISGNRAGRVLLALSNVDCSQWHAVEYDLARDRAELIYSSRAVAAIDDLKPGKRSMVVPGWPAQPPYLRVGDAIWTGRPFGRVERGTAGALFPFLEDKPELHHEPGGLEHDFNWRTMEPLDDGRIVVSDRHGVWLITP
jgi:hypothetical protein